MTDVVAKLWGFCDHLRHDGMNYGLYIEQLTYLLFLKMSFEKEIRLPEKCNWDELLSLSGTALLDEYTKALKILSKEKGILGDIFVRSNSAFNNPTNLKKLLNLMSEDQWTEIDVDVKGAAYEGLLEKYASNEKGAGQYFTPRVVIRSIIRCVKPHFTKSSDYTIHDPACGTCGFLIGAFEWIMKQTDDGSTLKDPDKIRLVKKTFSGMDNVVSTRRLGLMNCYLHEIEPKIYFGDSLGDGSHVSKRYNLILTNPPFGSSGAGGTPTRDDFLFSTANKQLNFIQHVLTILKTGGEAAIIVPDGVLFDNSGKGIREHLMKVCNLHTILRLPEGTFIPYANAKANVLFFTKGSPTEEFWMYDLRTNIPSIQKRKPLTEKLFEDFEECYHKKPRKITDRFKKFSKKEIESDNFNLDVKFVEDQNIEKTDDLPEPKVIANDISKKLETSFDVFTMIDGMDNSDDANLLQYIWLNLDRMSQGLGYLMEGNPKLQLKAGTAADAGRFYFKLLEKV